MKYLEQKISYRYNDICQILEGEFPKPRSAEVMISQTCNFSCLGCHSKKLHGKNLFMPISLARSIFQDWKESGVNVEGLVLSGGGEPTLNPDYDLIVKAAISREMKVGTITNGSIYTPWLAACSWVRVSLNAINELEHKAFTGTNTWSTVLGNLEKLLKTETKVGLKFLNRIDRAFNKEEVELFCKKYGIEFYQIQELSDSKVGTYSKKQDKTCSITPLKMTLNYDGCYYVCPFFHTQPQMKIGIGKFNEIWGSPAHREALAKVNLCLCSKYDCAYNKVDLESLMAAEVEFI